MALGSRVVVIDDGKIQQQGTPQELYDHPANRMVAEFIGSEPMEFFEGELDASSMPLRFTSKDVVTNVRVQRRDGVEREVVLGVRPEELALLSPSKGNVCGHVRSVAVMGTERVVRVELDTGRVVTTKSRRGEPMERGQRVGIHFPDDKIHLFDRGSGLRISE